uniref:Girdin-like n=1 Tax=Nothobranchius furzeri TaxID=105023 RepID=A0A8C6PFK5_NOTFU
MLIWSDLLFNSFCSLEQSLDEMKKLLLLLLGCAVQCETKEAHIERIQTLDFETKAAIAAHIQELTHNQENVLDLQWLESNEMHPEEMESVLKNTAALLRVLLDQRDLHLETIAELMQEKEGVVTLHSSPPSPQSDSFSPSMQHQQAGTHLGVELADSRAKVRRLRQELEEKSEQMLDCRHELENMEAELKRVQQENSQLLLDARVARTYRDELDALREQAIKADKLESEVGRYREQLHKMDFYKAKVEELKEDNRVLQETKEVLEDQLEGCRTRMDKIHQLEKHSLLLKAQILDMEQVRHLRLKELQEENLSLCLAQRRSMEESQHLGWELEQLSRSTDTPHGQQSLSEEVSERTRSQILKLQKDNQSLLRTIKELRGKTQTKHGPHLVCNIDNFASSAGDSSVMQTISCPVSQNHNDVLHRNALPLETRNRESDCSQILRKVQRLEAEIQELEAENQVLQASLEELRISARRLEQLEAEKQHLEHEGTTLERDKRQLEKENRRLRQQVEIQEANLDSRNVSVASLEREMRSLMKELEASRETSERVKSLERDKRDLNKQAAIDQKALAALREELVCEKLKTLQRDNDQEKLTHELEMRLLNQESTQQDTADNRRMLESELESSLKSSLLIKDDKIAALGARLQESSSLNQQLRHELKTVKLSNEALQQRQQEEDEWTASHNNPPAETMTEWLRESQEATRELLRLKDRLIQVERTNATLVAERQAMQMLLKQLESQSDGHQAQILTLQRQAASLQETNTALQTCNTNLQVEKSTLNSQSASLSAHNAQLQQQQAGMEAERDSAVQTRDELRGAHEQLLRDHERLAVLHERRAMEYEALVGKHACLKKAHRTLELEHRTLQDRYSSLLQQRTKLEELEKTLKEEQMRIVVEKEQHQTTAAECRRLGDEKEWLNQTYRQLLSDSEALTAEHKQLKSQLNEAKLERTWLEADFSKLKKEFQELDIASTKLTNQCELLSQLKGNLEEENRHLLGQIETLMLQNRTLLEQTMESKDLFHVEERQYIDKLNDLRRQKEKLEEKIMDQYKFYEPSPPRRYAASLLLWQINLNIKLNLRLREGLTHTHTHTDTYMHSITHILSWGTRSWSYNWRGWG